MCTLLFWTSGCGRLPAAARYWHRAVERVYARAATHLQKSHCTTSSCVAVICQLIPDPGDPFFGCGSARPELLLSPRHCTAGWNAMDAKQGSSQARLFSAHVNFWRARAQLQHVNSPPKQSTFTRPPLSPSLKQKSSPLTIKRNSCPVLNTPQNWGTNKTAYTKATRRTFTASRSFPADDDRGASHLGHLGHLAPGHRCSVSNNFSRSDDTHPSSNLNPQG